MNKLSTIIVFLVLLIGCGKRGKEVKEVARIFRFVFTISIGFNWWNYKFNITFEASHTSYV